MTRYTDREFLAWMAWLDRQWNEPDRTDHYLMQVALEVMRSRLKNPRQAKLSWFKLPFIKPKNKNKIDPKKQKERETRLAKAKWMSFVWAKKRKDRPKVQIEDNEDDDSSRDSDDPDIEPLGMY